MQRKTFFKNPSGPSHGSGTSSNTAMDAGKKITGLVKTGGSVIAGQVAAQLVTDLAIKQVGGKLPDVVIQAASVAGPIALGFGIGLLSKNENVQMAGIGCVAAGVGKASWIASLSAPTVSVTICCPFPLSKLIIMKPSTEATRIRVTK